MDALQLYLEVMEAENGLDNTVPEEDLNLVYVN